MITKYKIFENNTKIINIDIIIPNQLGIELEIKGEYIDLTTYKFIKKYIKNRYKYYNRFKKYKYIFFIQKYILFYLKQKFNIEPISNDTNGTYTAYHFKMTIEQAIDLSRHLPDDLTQDTIDKFCDEYLNTTINYQELCYKHIRRSREFGPVYTDEYLFSDKVKDKHRYIFDAENFDLI